MMTTPAIDVVTVEDIDLTPVCEARRHDVDRPRADFWVEFHGCYAKFGCAECVQIDRDNFAKWGPLVGIPCRVCGMRFSKFDRAVTKVVSIR